MKKPYPRREVIQREQWQKLNALLAGLAESNRFYISKIAAAKMGDLPASWEEFYRRFPFTLKTELMEDQRLYPPYGTDLTYPLECYTRCHQTSGTSGGGPLRWLDTAESWDNLCHHWQQIFDAAGVSAHDRLFFAFSFGPFLGFWSAFDAAARRDCFCLPGGAMNSVARLRAILDHGITVLLCTPTYALRLGEVARSERIDLTASQVRLIITAGEPGGSIPATRDRLAKEWPGARVYDHHGMTEVGPVSYECPAQPGVLHILESAYLAEIIDPASGQAMTPGTTGELVLTTLDRVGSPLVRYRTGDLVKARPATPCACGRYELALEGGILGRSDDMVVVRGVNIFPSTVEDLIRAHAAIVEYQVVLDTRSSLPTLSVQIEPALDCLDPEGLARRLEQDFQTAFALRVPVSVVTPSTLPRFEMKARRWHKL